MDSQEIVDFLRRNKLGVFCPGNYDLPWEVLRDALQEFTETGKSKLIKKHQEWTWGCWSLSEFERYGQPRWKFIPIDKLKKIKRLKKFWKDETQIALIDSLIAKEEEKKQYAYKRRVGFTKALKDRVKKRDGYGCVKCGATDRLQVDHIVPLILGGDNDLNNLQTLCTDCHATKTSLEKNGKHI